MGEKPHGIFLNTLKANCSIHESGKMVYQSLRFSTQYELDYLEIDESSRQVPSNYDFYAFNYHPLTMGWLDTKKLRRLPGLKITFVLEVLPNDPFVLVPRHDFNAYCALDPTMNIEDKRVYAFPRPLEILNQLSPYEEKNIPVIGSFGFATPGKGFELVVDAVNKEFEKAIIRINIPSGKYTDDVFKDLQKRNYAEYLEELCKKIAKPGIQVNITHDYMSKEDLIEWCGQNTLNCFLYCRNQPGLAATTDQAISSGRPLSVSSNETFRHIHPYIKPYPFQTLRESIASSQPQVLRMREDWSTKNFAGQFEKTLHDFNLSSKNRMNSLHNFEKFDIPKKEISSTQNILKQVLPKSIRDSVSRYVKKQNRATKQTSAKTPDKTKRIILIISNKKKGCWIGQYGLNIAAALQKSLLYSFVYVECSNPQEMKKAMMGLTPAAIIYNYYPATMPWLTTGITRQFRVPQLRILHDVTPEEADKTTNEMFDFHLCPDPTLIENNPRVLKTNRLIPLYINTKNMPDVTTVGSFGFDDNGLGHLVNTVQQEFDEARILLHLPLNDTVDKRRDHVFTTARQCQKMIKKPGIKLIINHNFLNNSELLDFLASNTLNAFFCDTPNNRGGVSSAMDYALAVQRPIAITKCGMFRHIIPASPSICVEDNSLTTIIKNGIIPLVPFYNSWSEANFILGYEKIISNILNNKVALNKDY